MRKSIAAALIAASAATSACGHSRDENAGPMVSRAFQVGNFTELEASGPFDVTVRTGVQPGVQVRGNQALIEKMVVEVRGDKLVIRPEEHHAKQTISGLAPVGHRQTPASRSVLPECLRALH